MDGKSPLVALMLQNGIAEKFSRKSLNKRPSECREGLKLGAGLDLNQRSRGRDYEPEFAFRSKAGDAVKPFSAFLLFK